MKPTFHTNPGGEKFPLVEYNFHASTLDGFHGRCAKAKNSFRDISREYFDVEANNYMLREAAAFGTLIVTAVVPIVSGLFAVLELCRAVSF